MKIGHDMRLALTREEQRLILDGMKDYMYKNAFMLVLQTGLSVLTFAVATFSF